VSGTDIFLSYARADRGTARMFAQALADEGFSVWWDASLHSGETFDEVIERNLREAKAVVVLWSPRSVSSRWVRAEATLADRRHKLVPAIIEPCDRPIVFELTHTADLSEWTGDITDIHWRTFMDDLRRLVDVGMEAEIPATARPPASPPRPRASGEELPARSEAANRRPLRPGNDEVIFADQMRRTPPAQRAAAVAVSPPPSDVHCLEVEGDDANGEPIVVRVSGIKIGRSAPADIVLSHKSVSREHCMIGLANDELLVTDLNSTNGTYIDDVRITRTTILPVGSVLRLGQLALRHLVHSQMDADGRSRPQNHDGEGGLKPGRLAATS
jgi:TIR domain-containing protein/FHA domain-containing protein